MDAADVVVVGSGATGSLVALRLAEAGHKVVVLEAGPARGLSELYSSTIWSRRLKWNGAPMLVDAEPPIAAAFEAGWGTGGSAMHHYACWFRMHPSDFKVRSGHGVGLDWPIDYEDLRPFYDAVQREVGIAGDAGQEVWRPAGEPYPMPPHPVFAQAELIRRGFTAQGLRTAPLPMAINSVPYAGRPPCIQDGWCDAGCPTGALANPVAVFGPGLARAHVELRHGAYVSRVFTDAAGRRAIAVEYYEAGGARRLIRADLVVLAAFAVETPRILLNSAQDRHPAGLANRSGRVGRGFTTHGAVNLNALFREETQNHLGRTGGQLVSQDGYARRPGVSGCTWRIAGALKLADLGGIANTRPELVGESLTTFVERASKHLAGMSALVENLPSGDNRVELASERDRFGIPLARIRHRLAPEAKAGLELAAAQGRRILEAAGAAEVWAAPFRTEHMMGGVVMGEDPASSVVNGFGQAHEVENLFVAGPSLFPTVGSVNPTFTASAVAARSAAYILREWRGLARV